MNEDFLSKYLEEAHKHCFNNKEEISKSDTCGCFYCREIFSPSEIKNWIVSEEYPKEETAQCPYCMIDSVIGNASGIEITKGLLIAMYGKYFNTDFNDKIDMPDDIWITYIDKKTGQIKSAPKDVFSDLVKKGCVKELK